MQQGKIKCAPEGGPACGDRLREGSLLDVHVVRVQVHHHVVKPDRIPQLHALQRSGSRSDPRLYSRSDQPCAPF